MSVVEAQIETNTQPVVPGFDRVAFDRLLELPEHVLLRKDREAAFERYASLPLPHNRMEEWRRTDPSRFPFKNMVPASRWEAREFPTGEWDELFDGVVTLSDGGYGVRDVHGLLKERGVTVLSLEEAAKQVPERLAFALKGWTRGVPRGNTRP